MGIGGIDMRYWWEVAEMEFKYPELRIRVKGGRWREFIVTDKQVKQLVKDLEDWL